MHILCVLVHRRYSVLTSPFCSPYLYSAPLSLLCSPLFPSALPPSALLCFPLICSVLFLSTLLCSIGALGGDLAPSLGDGKIFELPFLGKILHFNAENF